MGLSAREYLLSTIEQWCHLDSEGKEDPPDNSLVTQFYSMTAVHPDNDKVLQLAYYCNIVIAVTYGFFF